MTQAGRTAYRYLVALFVAGVVVQFFLAGLGAFQTQRDADGGTQINDHRFEHNFTPHMTLGFILAIVGLVVFLAALAGRLGRNRVLLALALPVLVELQSVFANVGPAAFRGLHVVNACVILVLSAVLARVAWREQREAARSPVTAS